MSRTVFVSKTPTDLDEFYNYLLDCGTGKSAISSYMSLYSCNFYVGCSNNCAYCYLKKEPLKKEMGGKTPMLKKCFENSQEYAKQCFEKELETNLSEIQKHGLLMSFTTDPLLPETRNLTKFAIEISLKANVPVKILTKRADWLHCFDLDMCEEWKSKINFGFTLTGRDNFEPNASTNAERIEAMKKLHNAGFRMFASIEPIIDFESSYEMIVKTIEFCDLFKIGLEGGKKYKKEDVNKFVKSVLNCSSTFSIKGYNPKFYFKDNLLQQAGICCENFPENLSINK